jgi:hypothetical protein
MGSALKIQQGGAHLIEHLVHHVCGVLADPRVTSFDLKRDLNMT